MVETTNGGIKKDEENEEQLDNIDEQYGEDDLINEIYNMNWNKSFITA